jgi:hypothetical protein
VPATATRAETSAPASVEELERLWRTPAATARARRTRRGRLVRTALGGRVLVGAWVAVVVVALAAAPAAENVTPPLWTDVVLFGFFLALAGAAASAARAPRSAFAASATAGALGTVLGIACRATEHHAGAWWIYETASFAGLAALSLAGLATRFRTST